MRQEDLNDMMRNPGEGKQLPARSLPKCPSCGEPYLGDGVAPCLECAALAQEQGGSYGNSRVFGTP